MGYMIWFYISWNFGIEDMILYPISEKKSYHIYIFFSLEIWSMSREKVCDPGEFIASFKPKKVWHSCLVCLGKIKNVRCWSGAVNYIKLLTTTVSNQKITPLLLHKLKKCESKNISIKIHVGACFVLLGWFDC